jgi:hypothetical protein
MYGDDVGKGCQSHNLDNYIILLVGSQFWRADENSAG